MGARLRAACAERGARRSFGAARRARRLPPKRALVPRRKSGAMKVKMLSRSEEAFTRSRSGDAPQVFRNADPALHPLEKAKEYGRALQAAKMSKVRRLAHARGAEMGYGGCSRGRSARCRLRAALRSLLLRFFLLGVPASPPLSPPRGACLAPRPRGGTAVGGSLARACHLSVPHAAPGGALEGGERALRAAAAAAGARARRLSLLLSWPGVPRARGLLHAQRCGARPCWPR